MGILDWFGGRDAPEEPWRKFARADVVEVLNADTGDMIEIRPDHDDPDDAEGLLIGFDYVDAQGACTNRAVLCHQVFSQRRLHLCARTVHNARIHANIPRRSYWKR